MVYDDGLPRDQAEVESARCLNLLSFLDDLRGNPNQSSIRAQAA